MKEFVSRLGLYIGSLAAVAFAFANPEPGTIVAAVCAVLGYLALDGWWFWVRRATPHDRELFAKFRDLLPSSSDPIKTFLSQHDFGNDFEQRLLTPLNHLLHEWENEEHRFHDEKLDAALIDFQKGLSNFSVEIGRRTAPVIGDAQMQTARVRHGDGGPLNERKTEENRDVLNDLASECYERHQKVMEQGRNVLRYQEES